MNKEQLEQFRENFLLKEKDLSQYACSDSDAIRLKDEEDLDDEIRPNFYHDIDRIIHSMAYTRYVGKTQVFSYNQNDHVSNRMIHVQLVSKIARTIGRALRLNEDLIEAMALGHDIGHTPLGHTGEAILNTISLRETNTMFNHNIHGVRVFKDIEKNGRGLNLTIQTLDGIMCHNGEIVESTYKPMPKTKEEFLKEYELSYTDREVLRKLRPMTLEGCVVRISDIIGYIGRDIEDAINLGILKREEVPENIREVLGTTNKEIVNTIITDIITNSLDKPYIKLSDDVFKAIFDLKEFNYKNIYSKANTKEEIENYRIGMNSIYTSLLNDIDNNNLDSIIYKDYLNNQDSSYLSNNNSKNMVIDYIAGMTDDYFERMIKNSKVLTKTN